MQITCTEKKVFEINSLEEYHGLNVQRNTLLLADVFENFRNILTKIDELEPAPFCLFFFFFRFCNKISMGSNLKKTPK